MRRPLLLLLAAGFGCKSPAPAPDAPPPAPAKASLPDLGAPPATKKSPVEDTFHGVTVGEDYRWLEDWASPEVKAWSHAQNAYARAYLDALPGRAKIEARVSEVMRSTSSSFSSISPIEGGFLALQRQPPKQQPFLVRLETLSPETATVVLDPNTLDPSGTTHIDWFVPSPSGEHVAVSLSKGGTEAGDVHVYEVASGKPAFEVIPRVNGGTAGGDLAWSADGTGFYYTRYPRGDERPAEDKNFYQQLYYHALGTPTEEDRYELGKDLPRIAEIQLAMHQPSGHLLVTVQEGDGGKFRHYLRTEKGYVQFSEFGDKILAASFGKDKDLYLLSRQGAPRGTVVRASLKSILAGKMETEVIVPESEDTIVEDFWGPPTILATDTRLYVLYQLGGPAEIRAFDHAGNPAKGPKVPPVSNVFSMIPTGGDDLLFDHTSFTSPTAYYRYDAEADTTTKTEIAKPAPIPADAFEVSREMTKSKDGTQIPVNIIRKAGLEKDGKAACVVYGYGGYGVNITPSYRVRDLLFAERGVVYAIANIRGGGEFGEQWHQQGNLTNKQNVFDDFAAAVEYMVDAGYCAKDRVGILGGSNGGLLMGATMVQHPELVQAVVSFVGIYDMLRVELSPNGAFNVTEFGTVKDKAQFEALFAYSPYHNVKDGVAYPPVLFITGENDPRVDPMQSRKMTARLQAATGGGSPALLRTTSDAGHGGGMALDERIAQYVDMYAFYFGILGVQP